MVVLDVIAYRKCNFREMEVPGAFLRSGHLIRNTYARRPDGAETDNVACDLSKPLYGMSTACKDWCRTIRDFLSEVCVCVWGLLRWVNRYSFGLNKGFIMGGSRSQSNKLDKCVLKAANANSETIDKRGVLRIIAIRVGDMLISGSS